MSLLSPAHVCACVIIFSVKSITRDIRCTPNDPIVVRNKFGVRSCDFLGEQLFSFLDCVPIQDFHSCRRRL